VNRAPLNLQDLLASIGTAVLILALVFGSALQ
jgi:hypothetical protein